MSSLYKVVGPGVTGRYVVIVHTIITMYTLSLQTNVLSVYIVCIHVCVYVSGCVCQLRAHEQCGDSSCFRKKQSGRYVQEIYATKIRAAYYAQITHRYTKRD